MEVVLEKLKKLDLLDNLNLNATAVNKSVRSLELSLKQNQNDLVGISRKLDQAEQSSVTISAKLRFLERQYRRNNIIIFNLAETEADAYELRLLILEFFTQVMKVHMNPWRVDSVTRIGDRNQSSRPIRVAFADNKAKWDVLRSTGNLKGTDIGIMHDLTKEERAVNKCLLQYREMFLFNGVQAKVRGLKLKINDRIFTLNELQQTFVDPKKQKSGMKKIKQNAYIPSAHFMDMLF